MKRSRRYREIKDKITDNKYYSLSESLKFLQENSNEKTKDTNIKASFLLNWINQKNVLKSKVILPNVILSTKKIVIIKDDLPSNFLDIFEKSEDIKLLTVSELKSLVEKKKSHWNFTKLLAHTNSESKIKVLEKLLGPKGVYPNKKNGLLTENLLEEIEKFRKGEKELKTDKGGNIHAVIGKDNFNYKQLEENYEFLRNKISSLRPIGWKGDFIKNITLSTTMGPGLKILL